VAQWNWSNSVTKWYFNPDNVRDPTMVFNNTALPVGGPIPGYGPPYDFIPINFAPNVGVPAANWTTIKLGQFGIPSTAKQIITTIDSSLMGPSNDKWNNTIYSWFRRPGSTWNKSPIQDSGYADCCTVFAPVGIVDNEAAIEMAWGFAHALPNGDTAWLTAILTGWGE